MKLFLVFPTLACLFATVGADEGADEICRSESNIFTVKVDLFASELGYYTFDECPGQINPTIGLEVGEVYEFVQEDISNYFHPLGFAYFPDGAHFGVDELEPTISQGSSGCNETATCPAPMYYLNGEYLGVYSNIPTVANGTTNEEDFGLDAYEPLFFNPITDWAGLGTFSIKLKFNDVSYMEDIFYFCHIHHGMSGRIKLLVNGEPINDADTPALEEGYYKYETDEFDLACGTFGLAEFQLPHGNCPPKFVCNAEDSEIAEFAACIDAMNCHMMNGMTTNVNEQSEGALFVHQMIPHHQNAVNMAKVLLKSGSLNCDGDDVTDEENPDCVLTAVIRDIVNTQNFQIQAMRGYLEAKGYRDTDNCDVPIAALQSDNNDNHNNLDNQNEISQSPNGSSEDDSSGCGSDNNNNSMIFFRIAAASCVSSLVLMSIGVL